MNAVDANDRTILTILQGTIKKVRYNKREFKEGLKCREEMMVIDNGLCCCNYCGKIRSTVYPYVRRNVCRFNTGYVRLENTKINTTRIYVNLRVPRLLGVLLETNSFNWGTNS
jgi:hypothetical protein